MKLRKAMMMIFLAAVLMTTGTAFGADVIAAIDVNSAYVWRGMAFNDGVVVQPSLDVAKGGFGINVWGNLDVDDYDDSLDSGEFSEIDLTMTYAIEAGPVGLTGGYIEYLFPTTDVGGAEGTREVFLDVALEPVDSFSVGVITYYDCDEVNSAYANLYVGYGMALDCGLGIDLGASAGYVGGGFSADGDAGFNEYNVTLGLGYDINDMVSVSASMAYTDAIDDDVLKTDTNFYGGAGVAFAF
jgi:hypothetical protein